MAKNKHQQTTNESRSFLKIDRWDWGYSFGINDTKGHLEGDYLDFRHLDIHGKLTSPDNDVRTPARITFVPSPVRDRARGPYSSPGIGSLWFDQERKRYLAVLSMPDDALPGLLTMLVANRLRYVLLDLAPPRAGSTAVLSYRFQARLDRNDLKISKTDYSAISRRVRKKSPSGRR